MNVPERRATGAEFLASVVRPLDDARSICPLPARPSQSAIYDDALVALVLMRSGAHDRAGRVLGGLTRAQLRDGALPFNVSVEGESERRYVRTGAMAWVGYAAAEYLDADRGGPHRDAVARMAHRIASFALERRVREASDPRAGLVRGGRGTIRYSKKHGKIRERFVPGELAWTSTEHNVDVAFFLRRLAHVSGQRAYEDASREIVDALVARAWNEEAGQFHRGVDEKGPDARLALDCATWGGLLLAASGDRARAERALASAEAKYASVAREGVHGHRPYADGYAVESWELRQILGGVWREREWRTTPIVWPEGSAGVALLAARLGDRARARALLRELGRLRAPSGALPTASDEVPFELDTSPSIAGTAWFELTERELGRLEAGLAPTFWV